MSRHTTIPYKDREVDGEDLDFSPIDEPWNVYELDDGGTVKVRVVVTNIVRATESVGGDEPLVLIKSKTLVSYHPPDTAKGKNK